MMRSDPLDTPFATHIKRAILLFALLAAGWSAGKVLHARRAPGWSPRSGRIRVLTTILPLYDFARQVGGDNVEVRNLLPPGVDPHEFALSPSDVDLVAGADVLIANGAGLDDFITDALQKAEISSKPTVECAKGLPMLASAEKESPGEHHHESGDPHLWLDPVNARTYIRRIADALATAAPTHVVDIRDRAAAYDAQLATLDADYRRALSPLHNRSFIAFHGAFAYLAKRYGLNVAAIWQTTPGREPAPRDVGAILATAHAKNVRALFAEPQFSSRAIEMIASDAHLKVYYLDPLETTTSFDRTYYLAVMRANLETLVSALSK